MYILTFCIKKQQNIPLCVWLTLQNKSLIRALSVVYVGASVACILSGVRSTAEQDRCGKTYRGG